MDIFETMRTAFAARNFTDKPVTDEMVYRILENARFAPSGGNRQGWEVLVVRDEANRAALGSLMRPGVQRYMAQVRAGEAPWNTIDPTVLSDEEIASFKVRRGALNWLVGAPVLLLVFVDLSVVASFDSGLDRVGVISGASVYPFVQNILLAARAEGLGGVPSTFAGQNEAAVQRLLGVPSQMAFAALIPLGYPVKQLTRLRRRPVESFARRERWDGPALGPVEVEWGAGLR